MDGYFLSSLFLFLFFSKRPTFLSFSILNRAKNVSISKSLENWSFEQLIQTFVVIIIIIIIFVDDWFLASQLAMRVIVTVIVPRPWGEKYFLASRSNVATIISPKKLLLSGVIDRRAPESLLDHGCWKKKKKREKVDCSGEGRERRIEGEERNVWENCAPYKTSRVGFN